MALKIHVAEEKVAAWERGDVRPTLRQARNLAKLYRQPFAAFFLHQAPEQPEHVPQDFRRLTATRLAMSSAIHLDVQDSWEKRDVALQLLSDRGEIPKPFSLVSNITDDPENVGTRLRQALGVTVEEQMSWRDGRVAFNAWRSRSEAVGVLVFQTSDVAVDDLRGYSLFDQPLPVIVVNRKDPLTARSFSLTHELVHLTLKTEGICDITTDVDRPPEVQRLEIFCNRAAAACLMPQQDFLNLSVVRDHSRSPVWSDAEIGSLARMFAVSRESALRRLMTFGLTTQAFYESKREQYQQEYTNQPARRGFVTPPVDVVSLLGRPFVRLVLSALDIGSITTSDASDYLGVRLRHLPAIAEAVE